jgi:hypothetical protein
MCGFWLENSGFGDPFLAPAGSQGPCCDSLAEDACARSPERGGGENGFILSGKQHLGAVNRE